MDPPYPDAKMIRFFGSIYFAILLIALSAIGVIAGTIIESKVGSHETASVWIYNHPLFYLLLMGYFVNILLSALSRWPFQTKHIPFLITHLGLLMVIAGVFIKGLFGVQGEIKLIEGTFTNDLILKHQKAIALYSKEGVASYPLVGGKIHAPLPIHVNHVADNGEERFIAGSKKFQHEKLKQYIAYDEGYGGYGAFVENVVEKRKKIDQELANQLINGKNLPPPFALMKEALQDDFALTAVQFLREWEKQGEWVFITDEAWLKTLSWNHLTPTELGALFWIQELFSKVDPKELLKTFPFPEHMKQDEDTITKEIWSIQEILPKPAIGLMTAELSGKLLSAFFRVYGIHLNTIALPELNVPKEEVALQHEVRELPPSQNREENRAVIALTIEGKPITLLFDPASTAIKWPLGDKKHLIRFEPHRISLPFSIELHGARDIKYPHSNQTISYECDLTIREGSTLTTCMLSMNEVHETSSGYRLYLAGITPLDSYGVKQVHLVVNKDPAKYFLTYPGGAFVSLGILLLFFRKRKQS